MKPNDDYPDTLKLAIRALKEMDATAEAHDLGAGANVSMTLYADLSYAFSLLINGIEVAMYNMFTNKLVVKTTVVMQENPNWLPDVEKLVDVLNGILKPLNPEQP